MKRVRLYGHLGRTFGREWRLDVQSPAEAVRAIACQTPGFDAAIVAHRPGFRVYVDHARLTDQDLGAPVSDREVIRIVPVIAGGKDDFSGIILGAALIGASFIPGLQGPLFEGATGFLKGVSIASLSFNFGVSMVLSGVMNALTSSPKPSDPAQAERPENRPSYLFNGPVNTTGQGNPVPILFGELEVGSQVLSAAITTEQLAAAAAPVDAQPAAPAAGADQVYYDPGGGA